MIRKIIFVISLILSLIVSSCGVSRVPVTTGKLNGSTESYIEEYKYLAISEMRRTGIPASITLAQGIIESGMGRSRLSTEANNHFGIKCHDDWTGPIVRHHDDRRNECFRKYKTPEESFKDHSDFLKEGPRYKFLFSLDPLDYKEWARGLKKAGYATNPDYANMLIRKIEEYSLYNLDRGITSAKTETKEKVAENQGDSNAVISEKVVGNVDNNSRVIAVTPRVKEKNRIQYIVVRESDTRESLEKEFNLLRWELARYNELDTDFPMVPGQILYLQPKRDKADVGKEIHTVSEGETMYSISQIYGIKLKSLLEMNRMTEADMAVAGEKIWLRNIKPVK